MKKNTQLQKISIFMVFFFFMFEASARVFSFEDETLAPYLSLRSGLSTMGSSPYSWQSAGVYSGDKADFIYGGEFGVYIKGSSVGMSLGILIHTFDPVTGGVGSDISSTPLYNVSSTGLAYGPSLLFDYQFSKEATYVWKMVLGGGYQFAKIENEYSYTAPGQALTGGLASGVETYKTAAPFVVAGISTEFVMAKTTTMSFMLGYHYNLNQSWKYYGSGQNLSGTYLDGDDVLYEDGSIKKIDWSYPFLQIGFQFYVDKIQ